MVGTGVGAINHVAWFVDDLDAECQRLKALGADEVMRADTGSLELAFYDGFDGLGPIVELYERNPYVLGVYDLCRTAAEGWDGTDPVRVQV